MWWAATVGALVGVGLGVLGHRARVEADLAGPTPRPPPSDAPAAAGGPQPNVVLVIGCTVRRDQVTPYGGASVATPFLAALAAGGARFTDGHTASAWTRASAASLLTGRPFRELGMAEPGPGPNQRFRLADPPVFRCVTTHRLCRPSLCGCFFQVLPVRAAPEKENCRDCCRQKGVETAATRPDDTPRLADHRRRCGRRPPAG
jgi:hypothetical protein